MGHMFIVRDEIDRTAAVSHNRMARLIDKLDAIHVIMCRPCSSLHVSQNIFVLVLLRP
jgi:hypothetical protein